MHTYLIIVINVNIMSFNKTCIPEQEKIKAKEKISNIHVAFKLSHEAFVPCLSINNVSGSV